MNSKDSVQQGSRIQWLSDLIRLEIALWERIDHRLLAQHALPLSSFETLYFIENAPAHRLRVGELSQALGITVGGTSKIIDKLERAGLTRREPDPLDRRAAQVALTSTGESAVAVTNQTYEAEMSVVLDAVFDADEQRQFHDLVIRLLATLNTPRTEIAESEAE